jgi:hypothetical protein
MGCQGSFGQPQFLLHCLRHNRENAQLVHLRKPQGWLRRTPTDNFFDEFSPRCLWQTLHQRQQGESNFPAGQIGAEGFPDAFFVTKEIY